MPFQGLAHKLLYVRDYIETLPDSDVVLFVDGYDVLILEEEQTLLNKFINSGHCFIVSGERYCWPLINRCSEFPVQPTSFRFVNSGVYIGYVHALKTFFGKIPAINPKISDQGILSAYYLLYPGEIHIDAYCDFFLTLAGVIPEELKLDPIGKKVFFTETGTTPCLIHGNGGSRPLYQIIYDRLF